MASRRRWYETQKQYKARLERERRKRRRRKKADPVTELLRLPRRAARRKMRSMTRRTRNKMKRRIRSKKRQILKGVFDMCPVCAKPDTPGHHCRVRFTASNAKNVRNRLAKQGGLPASHQNPNLWRTNRED